MHDTASQLSNLLQSILDASRLDLTFTIEPNPITQPTLTIRFSGKDLPMLASEDETLLYAIAHLVVQGSGLQATASGRTSIVVVEPAPRGAMANLRA